MVTRLCYVITGRRITLPFTSLPVCLQRFIVFLICICVRGTSYSCRHDIDHTASSPTGRFGWWSLLSWPPIVTGWPVSCKRLFVLVAKNMLSLIKKSFPKLKWHYLTSEGQPHSIAFLPLWQLCIDIPLVKPRSNPTTHWFRLPSYISCVVYRAQSDMWSMGLHA